MLSAMNTRRPARKSFIVICALLCAWFFGQRFSHSLFDLCSGLERLQWNEAIGKATMTQTHLILPECGEQRVDHGLGPEKLEKHFYRKDGLLEVNPEGPHPIFELMEQAQEDWEKKLKQSSKTLKQAVTEYRKRYNRFPPPGFDDWWRYVEQNHVQLPDEYDQIFNDLEPFWGVDPNELQKVQRDWEGHRDSYTIGKDTFDEPLGVKNQSLPPDRQRLLNGGFEIIDLLKGVQSSLPPFRAVFSPHDNPTLLGDYELKQEALAAAKTGKYIDVKKQPSAKKVGWLSACSPQSAARSQDINWGGLPHNFQNPKETKTFIYNHRDTMDPCQHPSHFLLHGQFISHRRGPVAQPLFIPQFSYSPTMLHYDITTAMPLNWLKDIAPPDNNPIWENRWDSRIEWRGSNTGIYHAENIRWDLAQRERLVQWAGDGESVSLGGSNLTVLFLTGGKESKVGKGIEVRKSAWAPAMTDIGFAGEPINSSPEMGKRLTQMFEFRKRHDSRTAGRYKYYVDVDGNGWSSRFKRLITSNALVFKSTLYPEWYTDRIAPWVHYVPVQIDLSDLWDALVFFRGDPVGKGGHEELAKRIATAGREWSMSFWRKEDLVAYMYRLFLEYARVMNPDRNSMEYKV